MYRPVRPPALFVCLLAATIGMGGIALMLGAVRIPPADVLSALFGHSIEPLHQFTLMNIRLPRIAMAIVIGAILGAAGASIQGLFRNPLAEPGLIGLSGGAALGAALMIGLVPVSRAWPPGVGAIMGALAATALALRLSRPYDGQRSAATLLLAGVAINALAAAGIALLTVFADDATLRGITFWMFGSLSDTRWTDVGLLGSLLIAQLVILIRLAPQLDALAFGEAEARHLGIRIGALTWGLIATVTIAVGVSVAIAGMIGFIGLIVPHIVRRLIGPRHRALIVLSALAGALILLMADTAGRLVVSPAELPVGVLTALLGAPFFLWMLAGRSWR